MATKLELPITVPTDLKGITSSIEAVEQLEDRVKALTTDTIGLRKEKEAVTAQLRAYDREIATGTKLTQEQAREIERLTLREKELANSVNISSNAQRLARQELRNLKFAASDAAQDASLLAAQFGVNLPASFGTLAARIPGVQNAISAAFSIAPVVALGAAIVGLFPHIASLIDKMHGIGPELEAQVSRIQSANQKLVPVEGVEDAQRRLARAQLDLRTQERIVRRQNDLQARQAVGAVTTAETREYFNNQELAKKAAEVIPGMQKAVEDAFDRLIDEQAKELRKAAAESKTSAGASPPGASRRASVSARGDERLTLGSLDERGVARALGVQDDARPLSAAEQTALLEKLFDERRRSIDETYREEQQLREKNERAEQAEYDRRQREAEEFEHERRRLAEETYRAEIQRREELARDMESMFDRITGGAHNMRDVLRNIWREMAEDAKHQFFRQLAGLSSPSAGGGGLFGGVLGGIFGGGGGGSTAGGALRTPPFVAPSNFAAPGASASSIGFGAVSAGTPPTAAAQVGLPPTTPLGNLLGRVFPNSLSIGGFPIGGGALGLGGLSLGLAGFGRGSLVGGLTGLGGGALAGFAAGGPIGAVVGGVIGGIAGLFGGDKKKLADTQIENAGFAQIKLLLEEYSRHRLDYASTLAGYQQIHQQMQAQFQRAESRRNEQRWFDRYVQQLQSIEDERNRRRGFLSALAVPEFHSGGYVRGGASNVPAMLQSGEFVMSRSAVDRLGLRLLEQLNTGAAAGAAGDDGMITVQVSKVDFTEAVEQSIPVILTRGGKASRLLRR